MTGSYQFWQYLLVSFKVLTVKLESHREELGALLPLTPVGFRHKDE